MNRLPVLFAAIPPLADAQGSIFKGIA